MRSADRAELVEELDTHGKIDLQTNQIQLHVERHLPFLVLYREPPHRSDAGTRAFVTGEASFLAASADAVLTDVAPIVDAVARIEQHRFGAFLLMELWAGAPQRGDRADFRIVAPTHGAPAQMLESLESGLVSSSVEDHPATVAVEYLDGWAPPGLDPILVEEPICHLGLEVPALHHDPATGDLRPLAHREMRHEVVRALRRGLHEFTHGHTPLRPIHFHELGPQALTDAVDEVDRAIAAISSGFDLVLHVTPVNTPAAKAEFEGSRGERGPEFLYRARTLDPDLVKRRLFNVPVERIEDPAMAHLFYEKREELDRKLTLVSDRNTSRFLLGSRAIYGDPDDELLATATRIVERTEPRPAAEPLPVAEVVAAAEAEVALYRAMDPSLAATVELRQDLPGVMVSSGNLLIGAASSVSEQRLGPLFAHEIGTHVLTHHNGCQQPFRELRVGTAGYEALQEGLAVLWEFLVGGLDAGRLRLLAGRVLAAHGACGGADFVETHRELVRSFGFGSADAFNIAMRIHRGGGFIKDVVYLRGLMQVLDYLASGEPFERLHLGKVAYDHLGVLEELQWRRVVESPRLLPRQFEEPDVQRRLGQCQQGLGIDDLLGSIG